MLTLFLYLWGTEMGTLAPHVGWKDGELSRLLSRLEPFDGENTLMPDTFKDYVVLVLVKNPTYLFRPQQRIYVSAKDAQSAVKIGVEEAQSIGLFVQEEGRFDPVSGTQQWKPFAVELGTRPEFPIRKNLMSLANDEGHALITTLESGYANTEYFGRFGSDRPKRFEDWEREVANVFLDHCGFERLWVWDSAVKDSYGPTQRFIRCKRDGKYWEIWYG